MMDRTQDLLIALNESDALGNRGRFVRSNHPSLEELVNVLQAHKEYCGMRRHVVIKGLREGALLEPIENGRNETESTGMKTTLKEVLNKMGTESMERTHGTTFLSIGEKMYN